MASRAAPWAAWARCEPAHLRHRCPSRTVFSYPSERRRRGQHLHLRSRRRPCPLVGPRDRARATTVASGVEVVPRCRRCSGRRPRRPSLVGSRHRHRCQRPENRRRPEASPHCRRLASVELDRCRFCRWRQHGPKATPEQLTPRRRYSGGGARTRQSVGGPARHGSEASARCTPRRLCPGRPRPADLLSLANSASSAATTAMAPSRCLHLSTPAATLTAPRRCARARGRPRCP
mmetsp:Transcript_54457/g.151736  ORF Transcript_54457/g.151736 Transcript_54457/m.151736 type:complete len:233 (-) Transcript_54457:2373-3071(-)